MYEAAQKIGLDDNTAKKLVIQTALGASKLASENKDLDKLIDSITSKGGTTEAALNSFKQNNYSQMVHSAMQAAKDRFK